MRYSMSSLVLATLTIGQAAAATVGGIHSSLHNHARKHAEYKRAEAEAMQKRGIIEDDIAKLASLSRGIIEADISRITSFGLAAVGINSQVPTKDVWIGGDGAYTNEFTNESAENLILVVWGVAGSWVNKVPPLVTVSLAPGQTSTLSFADGASGAWTAIYPDTQLVNGQISNTWGEFTFGQWGVVDVSREVNMLGHSMSIVGPTCTSDMNTCVFVCGSGDVCTYGYQLLNCENGSQPGANYGTYAGAPSGGCGGMGASAALKTTLS